MVVLEREVQIPASSEASESIASEKRVYSRFRIPAAAQFSVDCIRSNMQDHRIYDDPYVNNSLLSKIGVFFKHLPLDIACMSVSPMSFAYALVVMKYSHRDNGYVVQ